MFFSKMIFSKLYENFEKNSSVFKQINEFMQYKKKITCIFIEQFFLQSFEIFSIIIMQDKYSLYLWCD